MALMPEVLRAPQGEINPGCQSTGRKFLSVMGDYCPSQIPELTLLILNLLRVIILYLMGDYDLQVSFLGKLLISIFCSTEIHYTNFESMKTNLPLEEREFLFVLFCSSGTHLVWWDLESEILHTVMVQTMEQMVSKHRHMTSRGSIAFFMQMDDLCALTRKTWPITYNINKDK